MAILSKLEQVLVRNIFQVSVQIFFKSLLIRLTIYFLKFTKWIIKQMYYYLALNLMLKLSIRHLKLLFVLVIMPLIYEYSLKYFICFFKRQYLLFINGRKWVARYEHLLKQLSDNKKITQSMSYEEWSKISLELDEMECRNSKPWKLLNKSQFYDYKTIVSDCIKLKILLNNVQKSYKNINFPSKASTNHAIFRLMIFVRSRIERNYCGIDHHQLYCKTRVGTKKCIETFSDLLCKAIAVICDYKNNKILSIAEKYLYLSELRHVLGRTALCLSGGATFGLYHIGLCDQLSKQKLMPKIVSGSSIGAAIASYVCCLKYNEMMPMVHVINQQTLQRGLADENNTLNDIFRRFLRTGYLMDISKLRRTLSREFGDITFEEAYQKTGRILNITVTGFQHHTKPMLLNFLNAPNVVVWSAAVCSCAFPKLFQPQDLYIKVYSNSKKKYKLKAIYLFGQKFIDGSLKMDIPVQHLQQLFNVKSFIVSQVNPRLIFMRNKYQKYYENNKLLNFILFEIKSFVKNVRENIFGMNRGVHHSSMEFKEKAEYFGDVNIYPNNVPWNQFKLLVTNPSEERWHMCVRVGQQSVFEHISRITILLAVEFTLDESLKKITDNLKLNVKEKEKNQRNIA